MKKKKWYRGLSLADDQYVTEAHPDNVIKPKRNAVLMPLLAACACFTLILGSLWLFLPFNTDPPDVSQYADSDYYELIQKLNELTYEKPKYKNNAAKLWASLSSLSMKGGSSTLDGAAAPDDAGGRGDDYTEITDNQVEGIIEADRIKRSNTHIYYLDKDVLRIYAIDKENTTEVGSYDLYSGGKDHTSDKWEFFLSEDCKTVTVMTQSYINLAGNVVSCVELISLDVSDPESIEEKGSFRITGSYMTSRMSNGSILLLTKYVLNQYRIDFDDESSFLPQIYEGEDGRSIPADGIVAPDRLSNTRYTVVIKLDASTLALQGTAAYLSYSENAYVSENHVFLTRAFTDKTESGDGKVTTSSMTEISCLTYGSESFERKGSVTIKGYVKDQWSMDEYKNILRVFTTTGVTTVREQDHGDGTISAVIDTSGANASLYCVDLSTFEIVASVIDFAPPREEIRSVRFDKETAYVCTSIELSDPVFFFDLSDLSNITYKDTGTIEGFSSSLINLGNGYLLGIGQGDAQLSCKVEVYEETADGVRSVCSYELARAYYATEYKAYYVDRQNQLFGFGAEDYSYYETDKYSTEPSRYILLYFDGYELVELVNLPLAGENNSKRGVYIDGYMYIFGKNDFKVEKITY